MHHQSVLPYAFGERLFLAGCFKNHRRGLQALVRRARQTAINRVAQPYELFLRFSDARIYLLQHYRDHFSSCLIMGIDNGRAD